MAEDSTIEYITNIDSAKIEINSESINKANNILDENPYEDESEWKNYATEFETEEVEDHLEQSNEEIEDDKNLVQNYKDKHSYSDEKKPISISESDLITNSEPNSDDLISQSSNFEMNNSESDSDLISKLNKEILRIVQCPICDITFTGTSTTVKMHIKNVHKIYQGVEIHEKSKHSSQEQQGVEEQEILKSDTSNQFDEIVTNEESAPNMTKSDFQSDDVVTKFDMDETNLTNIVISCDKCDFKTTNHDTMNAHKNDAALEDDKSAQYNCGKSCGFKSCTINELKSHIEENHHHGSPIQTENVKSVKKNSKYSGNFVTCDKCGFAMTNVGEILTHEKVCHKITSKTPTADLVCQKCDFTTTEEKSMIAHNNHPHYKCDKCDFSDVSEDEIGRHKKNKAYYTPTKFKCTSCPFKFCTIFRLQYHEKSKHGKKAITPYFEKTQPVAVKFSCDKVFFLLYF